jgi:hypothetical protein
VAAVAAAVASFIIGATGVAAGSTAAAIITVGANLAVAVATQAVISAVTQAITKPDVAAAEGRPTEWAADPNAAIPFVMGRRGVSGVIVHRDTYGANNRYLANVTVYSGGGPINAYGDFLVDGAAVTFTGEAMNGSPAGRLYRQTKTGAQPDTALTSPTVSPSASLSDWGSSHKLSGYACSMITLQQDGDFKYWPAGIPRTLQELQGILAWDPRLDSTWPGGSGSCRLATPSTWVYSTNGAIHALKWALGIKHNGVMVGGIGAAVDGIDVTSFINAANVADTNSWTVSAVAYSDAPSGDDKYQVFEALLQSAGAVPARKAGKISCVSRGANPSSVVTITAADTAGPFEFRAGAPREGRINTIIPRCVQEAHEWEMVDLEPVISSTYVTEDGGATRSRGVTYPYVASANQAAQLAAYDIADSREGITGTITLKPYFRDLEPGDAFTINEDGFALSSQKCLVLSRSYDPSADVVTVTFRSETAAKHAWALGKSGVAPSSPTLGTVDPATVPTPDVADWSIAAGTGATPSISLSGAVPTSVTVSKVVVDYRVNATTDWYSFGEFGAETIELELAGLTASTAYQVGVSYRNTFGALGSRLTLGPATTPAATITGQGDLAVLDQVNLGGSGQVYRDDGTTRLTDALAVTSLGTAAAITSQGALATVNQVNLGASGRVYRDDGATRVTDALAITSLGTAAAITSQGALATLSTVDTAQIATGAATRVFNYADDTPVTPGTFPSPPATPPTLLYEDTVTTGAGECVMWIQWDQYSAGTNTLSLWCYVDDVWDHDDSNIVNFTDYFTGAPVNGGQLVSFQLGSLSAGSHTFRVYVYKSGGSIGYQRVRATVLNSIR